MILNLDDHFYSRPSLGSALSAMFGLFGTFDLQYLETNQITSI